MKIGIIDSGIGGIKVLENMCQAFSANFIYIFDKSFLPYGNKREEQIRERIISICNYLLKTHGVECIVIACNTASCVALKECKKRYSVPILGLIPPVKELSLYNGKTLILSTRLTSDIIYSQIKSKNIEISPQPKLAEFIEKFATNSKALDLYINDNLMKYKGCFDRIFLGCTHYYYIKNRIRKLLDVEVLDGRKELIDNIKRLIPLPPSDKSYTEFYYL